MPFDRDQADNRLEAVYSLKAVYSLNKYSYRAKIPAYDAAGHNLTSLPDLRVLA